MMTTVTVMVTVLVREGVLVECSLRLRDYPLFTFTFTFTLGQCSAGTREYG